MKHLMVFTLCIVFLVCACSSSKLVQEYKNPETDVFFANKVLVIGVTSNPVIRKMYETKLTEQLRQKGVDAVESSYFFQNDFTNKKQSKNDLDNVEQELLKAEFDAILITKVIGQRTQVTLVDAYRKFSQAYNTFGDYYYNTQYLFNTKEDEENIKYFSDTSLYCICPTKARELLWKGDIDIANKKPEKIIKDYTNLVMNRLGKYKLLFETKNKKELAQQLKQSQL